MLILIAGVSGVGKTTVIDYLVKCYQWKVVPTYTTRELRNNENDKINVSETNFLLLSSEERFIDVNYLYGSYYGTPEKEILAAIGDNTSFWALDYPIDKISKVFSNNSYFCVVIQPNSKKDLISQLQYCGRSDRIKGALGDLESNYSSKLTDINNFKEFINYKNASTSVARDIHDYLLNMDCFNQISYDINLNNNGRSNDIR
jgi:guanylate kinase